VIAYRTFKVPLVYFLLAVCTIFPSAWAQSSGLLGKLERVLPSSFDESRVTEKTGTFAIKPQFDEAYSFSEGLAAVRFGSEETGKWGFIDKDGKLVINPTFDKVSFTGTFRHGFVGVAKKDRRAVLGYSWSFIDTEGRLITPYKFGSAPMFSDDYADVYDPDTGKWGYINKQGDWAIQPQFDLAFLMIDGFAAVRVGDYDTGKWGFIDKTGRFVVNPLFDSARPLREGLAGVRVGDRWGFIDKTGEFVISPAFSDARPFSSDGYAAVAIGEGVSEQKWGLIDKSGEIVVPIEYGMLWLAGEGLVAVRVGDRETGKYGFIDFKGRWIVNPTLSNPPSFSMGLAPVKVEDSTGVKWGYINPRGEFVIAPQFAEAGQFGDNLAPVAVFDGNVKKWGFIHR